MNQIGQIVQAMQAPAQDRTTKFMERLERHLTHLPEDQHVSFVAEQLEKWREDYVAWAHRIDTGQATPIDLKCDAYDYLFTIMALGKKAKELAGQREGADA